VFGASAAPYILSTFTAEHQEWVREDQCLESAQQLLGAFDLAASKRLRQQT